MNEDLGLIDYVFSDKTGTLTKNNMVFKSLYANNTRYGAINAEPPIKSYKQAVWVNSKESWSDIDRIPKSSNRNYLPGGLAGPVEIDPSNCIWKVKNELKEGTFRSTMILDIITCCHEVIVKKESTSDEKSYNASSPDELALLDFGNSIGYEFLGFDDESNEILVQHPEMQHPSRFKRLAMFRFSSDRGRMSVLVKNIQDGKTYLMVKGADYIMIERSTGCEGFDLEELNIHLHDYSSVGLRTLVYAYREFSDDEIHGVLERLNELERSLAADKDKKVRNRSNLDC